jgi:aspartyl-tRNA(Asn)/glutamyl-tRNA(Gln) amidotransferase subunit A
MADGALEALERSSALYDAIGERLGAVISWLDPEARGALEQKASRGGGERPEGVLEGWLAGVKDNIDTADGRTTAGAAFWQERRADIDAACVRALRRAGGVVLAKCNLAEVAMGGTTQNRTFGSCRNPWNLDRIPGGSSGGSAVVVAARLCRVALGTDTGASTRLPACVNGILGLRPTIGRISTAGTLAVAPSLDTVGPMARTAADLAALTAALSCPDPEDPFSSLAPAPDALRVDRVAIEGLRIGVAGGLFAEDVDAGVAECVATARSTLERLGAHLVDVEVEGARDAFEHWTKVMQAEAAFQHRERLAAEPASFSPDVLTRLRAGDDPSASELAGSYLWRARYRRRLELAFSQLDAVIAPTLGADVPPIEGEDSLPQTRLIGRLTYPWAMYHGPTLNLPVGFHPSSGMPVGMAVVAAPWAEAVLIRIAAAYQDATRWYRELPPVLRGLQHLVEVEP